MSRRSLPLVTTGAAALALSLAVSLVGLAMAKDPIVVVRPGQTLSGIALEHGVSVEQLAAANGISDPNRIYVGQRLKLVPSVPAAPATHVVKHGENLTWIARQHGTSVAALAAINALANPSLIRPGLVLQLPTAGAAQPDAPPAKASPSTSHRVAYGETLSGIAAHYRTTVARIMDANHLTNASYIRAGQVLTIPGSSAASPPAASAATALPASMADRVAARDGMRRLIVDEAARQGVPPAFALAVAWQESGWQQGVVSVSGAIGVMQLLPATGDWVAEAMLGESVNLWDARSNVHAGVRLLKHYLDRYAGNRSLVLAAYYQGQTAVDRHGVYAVSRPYIDSILVLERLFAR
jgi:LysM repeat protein